MKPLGAASSSPGGPAAAGAASAARGAPRPRRPLHCHHDNHDCHHPGLISPHSYLNAVPRGSTGKVLLPGLAELRDNVFEITTFTSVSDKPQTQTTTLSRKLVRVNDNYYYFIYGRLPPPSSPTVSGNQRVMIARGDRAHTRQAFRAGR